MSANTNQPAPSSQQPSLPSPSAPAPRARTWGWTGFTGKTFWDWLQLLATLAVPLALGLATYSFNAQQATLADNQHNADKQVAQNQHNADKQAAQDQQQETALQSYLDRMSDLLNGKNAGDPKLGTATKGDQLSQIARARTLTVLRSLDGRRKGLVLQFLYDAKLIGYQNSSATIVDLHGADLTGTSPGEGANLDGIDLSGTDLSNANLNGADLSDAHLNNANLSNALLARGVNLSRADLNGANLSGANLSDANLTGVILIGGANLNDAILTGANLTDCNLLGAVLQRANLSDVEFWHTNLLQANLGETNLNGADLSGAQISTSTYFAKASYTSRTNWPDQFDPKGAQAVKTNVRGLPAFVDFNVSSPHYHLANATLQTKDFLFRQNHIELDSGQQVAIQFDLQKDDLVKTMVTVKGLISQISPNSAGFAPINLQLNGHPPFKLNYTMPGGGGQPNSQSFSAPPEQLVAGPNTLTLTVVPGNTTKFWLYRLEVNLKPS